MARRRRRSEREEPSLPSPEPPDSGAPAPRDAWQNRDWFRLYALLFVGAECALLLVLGVFGGDSRVRQDMLRRAEAHAAAGESARTMAIYEDYARRWPGALGTPDFERRLGETLLALGRPEEAARHLEESARAKPAARQVRALAAEAWWKAGNRERALRLFEAELDRGDAASALAHRYLGLDALDRGDAATALAHFQAIEGEWPPELLHARERIQQEVVAPAKERALNRARALGT